MKFWVTLGTNVITKERYLAVESVVLVYSTVTSYP